MYVFDTLPPPKAPPQFLLEPDTELYYTETEVRVGNQSRHHQSPRDQSSLMKEEHRARAKVHPLCTWPQLSSSACRKCLPIIFWFL